MRLLVHWRCQHRVMSVVLVLGMLALSSALPARAEVERVTIALPAPVVLFLTIYVAEDYFWPQEELEAKLINLPGVASMNSMIAGSTEFALASSGSITRAAAHGQRLLAIANLNNESG